MKAYVIKNKEGTYFSYTDDDYGFNFDKSIDCAFIFTKRDDAEREKDFILRDCYNIDDVEVVPITIYEGDPLKLACEELEARDEGKTHTRLFIQKIKNNYLGDNVGYEEYFIQQAKESEKDEYIDN